MNRQDLATPKSEWCRALLLNRLMVLSYDAIPDRRGDIALVSGIRELDTENVGEDLVFWTQIDSAPRIARYVEQQPSLSSDVVVWSVSIAWFYSFVASNSKNFSRIICGGSGNPTYMWFPPDKALLFLQGMHRRMRERAESLRQEGICIPTQSPNDEFVRLNQLFQLRHAEQKSAAEQLPIDCPHCGTSMAVDEVLYLGWRDGELPYIECDCCHSAIVDAPFCCM